MLAIEIMTPAIVSITPESSIVHAAQLMLDKHVSGLVVLDDEGKLVGMLTEGDLLLRSELGTAGALAQVGLQGESAAREYIRNSSWRVGDVMTTDIVTVDETAPVDRLAVIMGEYKIKRLPVMRGDRIVGIVSRADILRALVASPKDSNAQSDDALQRAVSTRLQTDLKLDPAKISVTVHDGNVRLSGDIASEAEAKAAVVAAETVQGIRGVVNELRILE